MTTELDWKTLYISSKVGAWTLVLTLVTCGQAIGGERGYSDPVRPHFLQRLRPAGGWHPDGDGLLHWWNSHCFPRGDAPDDYCRKPLPEVCWPPYPPYYIWGTPEIGYPRSNGFRDVPDPASGARSDATIPGRPRVLPGVQTSRGSARADDRRPSL